jgi:hypothetical protein
MEIISAKQENEPSKLNILSADETAVLSGVEYDNTPKNFTISATTLEACMEVWKAFDMHEPLFQSRAHQRLANFLQENSPIANSHDLEFAKRAKESWLDVKKDREFGLQFYQVGNELIKGAVHPGKRRTILLRNDLDGIADSQSILHIHTHPDDMMMSAGDLIGMVADMDKVPAKCLYLVITPKRLHLMFPTNETQRYPLDGLRDLIREKFGSLYEEAAKSRNEYGGQPELIKALAKFFKLGYYSGGRKLTLPRVG